MEDGPVSRRSLLGRWLAVGGVAGTALAAAPARAFRIETLEADAPLARLYGARCGLPDEHAEIRRRLAAAGAGPAAGADATAPSETCPLCGCRVTLDATEPEPVEAPPR